MIQTRSFMARRRMAGLSLIELMVALVLGLFVAAGIISVFASTSSSNKAQQQMATLQEEGRFAIHSLRTDLANANGGYCSNTGGNAGLANSGLYLDALRGPLVYATNPVAPLLPDNTVVLPVPAQAYSLPSSVFMRGYGCTATGCTPVDPNTVIPAIPAMGAAVNSRVVGADVLTIRYLRPGSGWAIVPSTSGAGTKITPGANGTASAITLQQLTGEDPISSFTGTLAMLADCSNAQVFAVTNAGGVLTPSGPGANFAQPLDMTSGSAPRVFDFINDFQTITYYLKVVDAGNGHTTGELVRRLNGVDQPLVRGVERLNFLYGVINASGNTEFLTANQVDTATDASGNSIPCPPDVSTPGGMPVTGCLWRAVQTIEVHVLMDGQTPLYTLTQPELAYTYTPDGGTSPTLPSTHTIAPSAQGFPDQLLRREFTALVALRNFNP